MAHYKVDEASLTSVADAIRERAGTSEPLVFPEGFKDGVDIIYNQMESIITGKVVSVKNDTATSVGGYIFRGCANLVSAEFSKATSIGTSCFHADSNLANISFPNLITVGGYAFHSCHKLINILFPKVETVGQYAFENMQGLVSADFPSLKLAQYNSFNNCQKLIAFIIRNESAIPTLNAGATTFNGTPLANGTGYFYVPRKFLSDTDASKDYRRATNWSAYQYRALEDYTVDGTITGELDWDKINAGG